MSLEKLVADVLVPPRVPGALLTDSDTSHRRACLEPREGFEVALSRMLMSLADYAGAHERAVGAPIAHDYLIGRGWEDALKGFVVMLNGERGRLDGSRLHAAALALYAAAGFEGEL